MTPEKQSNFNETYKFTILAQCNPKSLDISEHKWIKKLKTITPYGLNHMTHSESICCDKFQKKN